MFVLHIILGLHLLFDVVQTYQDKHGRASKWLLVETKEAQKSRDFGVLQHASNQYANGTKYWKTNYVKQIQNQSDLDDHSIQSDNIAAGEPIDQSCSSFSDCYEDCKLCDGLGDQDFNRFEWQCDCLNGNCTRLLYEKKHMRIMEPPPKIPLKGKCVQKGKCVSVSLYNYECDGKCIKNETPCNGKCELGGGLCKKDGKCFLTRSLDRVKRLFKSCDGECIDLSENCHGKCADFQCQMTNGTCLKANDVPGRGWKDCKGKCIKSTLKCDGTCEWNQCEKDDGKCAYTVSEDSKNLNFGVCGGKCLNLLTRNSTDTCNGRCEWLENHDSTLEFGKCFYEIAKSRIKTYY